MNFRIEPALLDVENIRDYIMRDLKYYAKRLVEKVIEVIHKLENFLKLGWLVPEAEEKNIRELLFHTFSKTLF